METPLKLQVGVKIFLENDGKYLLLKRSTRKYPNIKNLWDIPGGRIIPGTTLEENIRREVFEETKLSVLGTPVLIAAQDIIRIPEKHIVRLTYCAAASGDPVLDEEHTEFKWLTLAEFRALPDLDEFTREVLEKVNIPKYE